MKTVIFTGCLCLLSFLMNAQSVPDSLIIQRLDAQERAINSISLNLDEAHYDFRTGAIMFMIGAGIGVTSTVFQLADPDGGDQDIYTGLTAGGGLLALIGGIVMIDSHKWIGDAGKLKLQGTSVTYRF